MRSKERLREEYIERLQVENEKLRGIIADSSDARALDQALKRISELETTIKTLEDGLTRQREKARIARQESADVSEKAKKLRDKVDAIKAQKLKMDTARYWFEELLEDA